MRRSMTRSVRARLAVAAVAGVLALSTTGCSLLSGGDSGDDGGGSNVQVSMGPNGKVSGAVASVTRPYGAYNLQVDIVSLKRYDKALRLIFVVVPHSGGGTSDDLDQGTFGNSETPDYSSHYDVSDVKLVDTNGMKQYSPMTTGSGDGQRCACSHDLDDYSLGNPTTLYADYPMPPDSVTKLTVDVPHLGPIPNVKVTS